ncbi:MAG TPA: glutathione S-transferase family protein [Rhizomicrobium sp.]|nr:glutathione S-transferase family protein [Rhizomicrobium sp.]
MKLYTNAASPFARKCRVIAHELGLKLEEIRTLPMQEPEFRKINPLGKIPALILDDGSVLIDSPVICEYLSHAGGGKFFPADSIWKAATGRWKALGLQALGDGLADAAVAWMIEGRQQPVNETARARHMAAVLAAMDALERVKFAQDVTIGEISVACALGYVEFRMPDLDWKTSRPNLSAWYAKFCEYPSMKATAPAQP